MSLTKAEIKYLRSLSRKKCREQEKKFLLEGWRPLQEALGSDFRIEYVAVDKTTEGRTEHRAVLAEAKKKSIAIREISRKELDQVSSTVYAQGILALVHQKEYRLETALSGSASLVVAADAVSDPGNLGSMIRSCDWFAANVVLLGKGCVELYNEKVVRTTAGSMFHLPIIQDVDLSSTLKQAKGLGYTIISSSGDGTQSYLDVRMKRQSIFVFGSEAHGISPGVRRISDASLTIPRHGAAESLNVGVACGIVLAHFRSHIHQ